MTAILRVAKRAALPVPETSFPRDCLDPFFVPEEQHIGRPARKDAVGDHAGERQQKDVWSRWNRRSDVRKRNREGP